MWGTGWLGVCRMPAASPGLLPQMLGAQQHPRLCTLVTTKYVPRHRHVSAGAKSQLRFENHYPEGNNCPVSGMDIKNSEEVRTLS